MEPTNNKVLSSIAGILTAIPIYIVQSPYYALTFLILFIHLFYGNFAAQDRLKIYAFTLLVILVLFSNIVGTLQGYMTISIPSIFYFLTTVFILAFAHNTINVNQFLRWFLIAAKLIALYVTFLFLSDAVFNGSFHNITTSEGRMWAVDRVLGWPNGFAIVTSIAAYLCFVRNEKLWSFFLISAALITFSRMPMIFFVVLFFLQAFALFRYRILIPLFIVFIFYLVPFLYDIYITNEELLYRVFKYSDRLIILNNLIDAYSQSPAFGIGNVSYAEISLNDIYVSYHSTFLKVLVRYGPFGIFLFFLLLIPNKKSKYFFSLRNILLMVLLLLAIPQDYLLLPSIALLYSLVAHTDLLLNASLKEIKK